MFANPYRLLGAAAVVGTLALAGCSSSTPSSAPTDTTKPPASSTTSTAAATTSSSPASTTATTAAPPGSTAAAGPPCTMAAVNAGIPANSPSLGQLISVNGFGCSGGYAYAEVSVGTPQDPIDAVVVLQANGSSWALADRATACNTHAVPAAIYQQACTTS